MEAVWRSQLGAADPVSVVESFFDLGGDSLKAGQLINALRKKFAVKLAVADLFAAASVELMARKIDALRPAPPPKSRAGEGEGATTSLRASNLNAHGNLRTSFFFDGKGGVHEALRGTVSSDGGLGMTRTSTAGAQRPSRAAGAASAKSPSPYSSESFGCLAVQAVPVLLLHPLNFVLGFLLIVALWATLCNTGFDRLYSLLIALFLGKLIYGFVGPLLGVALKWIIIGRYRPGKYPLWGSYYLRWWLVERSLAVFGKGLFFEDLPVYGPRLVRFYYQALGCKIGANAKISLHAQLAQADLVSLGDDVILETCIVRPFALEQGHFVLLPITIGNRCTVGIKANLAPGTVLRDGAHVGPLSSSHSAEVDTAGGADPRQYCRASFPGAPLWAVRCVGLPVLGFIRLLTVIPWVFTLEQMVKTADEYHGKVYGINSMFAAFKW